MANSICYAEELICSSKSVVVLRREMMLLRHFSRFTDTTDIVTVILVACDGRTFKVPELCGEP